MFRSARRSHPVVLCSTAAALGRSHAAQTITVHVSGAALATESADDDTRVIHRTTTQPVHSIKGQRPRTAAIS
jgi:hypothetical protein